MVTDAGELPDDLGEPCGLVEGNERVAVLHLDQLSVGEELGEPLAVFEWHHPVSAGSDDKGRVIETRQALSRLEEEAAAAARAESYIISPIA
jgi:hypothetical protein